jgi:gas vesicle protein
MLLVTIISNQLKNSVLLSQPGGGVGAGAGSAPVAGSGVGGGVVSAPVAGGGSAPVAGGGGSPGAGGGVRGEAGVGGGGLSGAGVGRAPVAGGGRAPVAGGGVGGGVGGGGLSGAGGGGRAGGEDEDGNNDFYDSHFDQQFHNYRRSSGYYYPDENRSPMHSADQTSPKTAKEFSETDIRKILAEMSKRDQNGVKQIIKNRQEYKLLIGQEPKLKDELRNAEDRKKYSLIVASASLALIIILSISLLSVAPGSGSESIIQSLKPDPSSLSTTIDSSSIATTNSETAKSLANSVTTQSTAIDSKISELSSANDAQKVGIASQIKTQAETLSASAKTLADSSTKAAEAAKAVTENAKTASSLSTTMSATNAMIAYNFAAIGVALPFISLVVSAFFALNANRKATEIQKKIELVSNAKTASKDLDEEIIANKESDGQLYIKSYSIEEISQKQDQLYPSNITSTRSFSKLLPRCLGRSGGS